MKRCTRCKEEKRAAEFAVSVREKDGRQKWCKACHSRYQKERWATDADARRRSVERVRAFREARRERASKR